MRIYSEVRLGVKPEINAICTIMIAVAAMGVIAAALVAKHSELAKVRSAGKSD
jgi:putrescine transport system permease protein